ncbi:AAA family ATPase [Marinilactibacillus psychrotolerans]|uniref:AAA family ATPase n=1 Tax=Marinilactibacillus psychrotolerans TaxID=191770 RepID=A0AAV3W9X8_9LACT|nr:AAA family ATPase [Marinilactibacillus psychrotolerans]GEL68179.1 topology modulation protein [Marinilactibacillus psychrotolerans]GEQ36446.1 DNA topology modulation protein FlaR [Marinilactibacillus psychrotolerans]SDD46547.1 Adenylate kinase [Marinilactibacillus psychrotolerans]
MKRILIIGSPGSGKSTLAVQLSKQLDLPVVHLDKLNWKGDKNTLNSIEFDKVLEKVLKQDKWIIDGNYGRTLRKRIEHADTIIWLDLPRLICVYRICKRYIKGKITKSKAYGNPIQLEPDFLSFVWNFNRTNRPDILNILNENGHKEIIILKNQTEIDEVKKQF